MCTTGGHSQSSAPKEVMYNGRRYRLRKASPAKEPVHVYVHRASHRVVGFPNMHLALQEIAPAVNAELVGEIDLTGPDSKKMAAQRLYVDKDDNSFFYEVDVQSSAGGGFDKIYAEVSPRDALRFFFTIRDHGGTVHINEKRARELWGKAYPIHAFVHKREAWEREELDPKSDLEAKERQAEVAYVQGEFCAPPNFKVLDWKYNVPQWVAEAFVQLLEAKLREAFPEVPEENVTVDLYIKDTDAAAAKCWGMVIPRNMNNVEIRGEPRLKAEKVAREVWHAVYDEYSASEREKTQEKEEQPAKLRAEAKTSEK